MMRFESFHINKDLVSYEIYPSVIVNILSHHQRRLQKEERVFGVLLGTYKQRKIQISDSYAIQTMIKDEEMVSFEEEMCFSVLKLKQRVNPNEIMVGWYSTLSQEIGVNYISALLDGVLSDHAKKHGSPAPCYLTIDTNLTNKVLKVRLYRGKLFRLPTLEEEDKNEETLMEEALHRFDQAPLKLIASDAEKIALNVILKSPVDESGADPNNLKETPFDSPSTIQTDMEQMISNFVNMMCDFEDVGSIVERIIGKELKEDPQLAWKITSALASSPNLLNEILDKQTSERVNDILMVKLLVVLTKAQVEISKHLPGIR